MHVRARWRLAAALCARLGSRGRTGIRDRVQVFVALERLARHHGRAAVSLGDRRLHFADVDRLRMSAWEIVVDEVYRLPPGTQVSTIVDAGANIGLASAYFHAQHPSARILAFEPDDTAFEILSRNLALIPTASSFHVALAGAPGRGELYTEPGSARLRASLLPSRGGSVAQLVDLAQLSSFTRSLDQLDLVKIDVEGGELPILEDLAASGELARCGRLFIEVHHQIPEAPSVLTAILALLEEGGFDFQLDARSTGDAAEFQDVLVVARHPQRT